MDIEKLYDKLCERIAENIFGELTLVNDHIVWWYDINHCVEIIDESGISEEDVEIFCKEEKFNEKYNHDKNLIRRTIYDIDDSLEILYTNQEQYKNLTCFKIKIKKS